MKFSLDIHPTLVQYVMKNKVGVAVYYDKGKEVPDDVIKKNHYGVNENKWVIMQAKNVSDAVRDFYSSYEGAMFGGKSTTQRALRIDKGRSIVQLPHCRLLNVGKYEGHFLCGPPNDVGYDSGLFGMCVLGGVANRPDGECAMKNFCQISSYDFSKRLPRHYKVKKIIVDNIVYKFAELN